jgi:hypothetical protein
MSKLERLQLLVAAVAVVVPTFAHAQSTTAFDGTYRGVSRVLVVDNLRHTCPPSGGLAPLMIAKGSARVAWGNGTMEGPVNPNGVLTMQATNGAHFDGQIDSRGVIKGRTGNFVMTRARGVTGCGYDLTWQKQR